MTALISTLMLCVLLLDDTMSEVASNPVEIA